MDGHWKTGQASHKPLTANPDWLRRFRGMRKEQVFDLVTAQFLELRDDETVARILTEQHKFNVTVNIVRSIRYDAAAAADNEESRDIRKKWAFRYQNATVNNVIKEYMFLAKLSSFLEAKMELGDELFWLQKKYSREEILNAVCEVVGRKDIPVEMIDELVKFREATMRIKKLLKHYSENQQPGMNVARLLLEVAEKIVEAYSSKCERNTVKTAEFACEMLKLEPGSVTPADIDFLKEFMRSAHPPERSEKDSMSLMLDGADSLKSHGILDEVLRGNFENISPADARQLLHELCNNPVVRPEQLKGLNNYVSQQVRRRAPGRKLLRNLKDRIEKHMRLSDVRNLLSLGMRIRLSLSGVRREQLQKELEVLNSLSSYEEALSYLHGMIRKSPYHWDIRRLAGRYCTRRFGKDFVKEKRRHAKQTAS